MYDIKAYIRELRTQASLLRSQIENTYASGGLDSSDCGIHKLLGIILEDLTVGKVTPERLRGNAFGIFRIVTDGWILEDTEVGRDVMAFRLELRKLADMLEQKD